MSGGASSKTAGIVLIVASVLGVVAISFFSPSSASTTRSPAPAAGPQANALPSQGAAPQAAATSPVETGPAARDSSGMFVVPSAEPTIEHIESPFTAAGTDSVAQLCAAKVRSAHGAAGADTNGVEIGERYGVHPIPGRGRDSLIVDGTAPGRDATPAVWHCAATTTVDARAGALRFVVEDGWPGVSPRFQSAHPITVAAEDLCLQRTKPLFPASDFRSVKRWRVADTLHVTGETMPLDAGDLSGDFHCRAIVHQGAIVSVVSVAGRD